MKGKVKVTKIEENDSLKLDKHLPTMNGVILFHHPGCIHCIMLKPKWELMKKKINSGGEIMEVNAKALEESKNPIRNKIDGFPMIVRVQNGEITDKFSEERNIENMLQFVTKHLNDKTNNLDYNYKLNKVKNLKKIKKTKGKNNKKNKTRKTQK
jgi:thiol-disulfide isomerase/thioredoxin